jgi:signal peptidase I
MSDEPLRHTEIDALMQGLSPDDPGHPVETLEPESFDDDDEYAADEDDTSPQPTPGGRKKRNAWTEWFIVITVAVTAALVVRAFVLQQFAVSGHSMDTTLHNGDRVLVNKLSYRLHDPRRGDVVVLKTIEGAGERDLIKRVVGLPGETVEYRSCILYIDGRELVEPYLDPAVVTPTNCGQDQAPKQVPADQVFVMGDNRPGSKDSRALGPIKYNDLIGRAFVVIWPAGDWRWL